MNTPTTKPQVSQKVINKRKYDLFHKQKAYWKKHWGLIVDTQEEYEIVAQHSREIKKCLDIIPLIQSLKFIEVEKKE